MNKILNLLLIVLLLSLTSCYDNVPFDKVRCLKTGMTISEAEYYVGEPLTYKYLTDTTESRTYAYDNPGNGTDVIIRVYYCNDKVKRIGGIWDYE